jgi:hypothetical protein
MNAKRITLRSLVRRRVCFGGFRRRTWRYHGLCPWGSMLEIYQMMYQRKIFGRLLNLSARDIFKIFLIRLVDKDTQ